MQHLLQQILHEPSLSYILKEYPTLKQLSNATETELIAIPGIGPSKAKQIRAIFHLGRELLKPEHKGTIKGPRDVYDHLQVMALYEEERMVSLCLDTKNHIIGQFTVSKGTIDACLVHPRDFFVHCVRCRCSSVIAVHNHPSGDPTPSEEDIALTRRLKECGELLGIQLLDHVIIGATSYVSLKQKDIL